MDKRILVLENGYILTKELTVENKSKLVSLDNSKDTRFRILEVITPDNEDKCKVGDRLYVMKSPHVGTNIKIEDQNYVVVHFRDVLIRDTDE